MKQLYYTCLIMWYYVIPQKRLLSFYLFLKHKQGYDGTIQELSDDLSKYKCLCDLFHIKTK